MEPSIYEEMEQRRTRKYRWPMTEEQMFELARKNAEKERKMLKRIEERRKRSEEIIKLRMAGLNYGEIGEQLGISGERVQQLLNHTGRPATELRKIEKTCLACGETKLIPKYKDRKYFLCSKACRASKEWFQKRTGCTHEGVKKVKEWYCTKCNSARQKKYYHTKNGHERILAANRRWRYKISTFNSL